MYGVTCKEEVKDQEREEVNSYLQLAGQLTTQCVEVVKSRDSLVIGLRERDDKQDRRGIMISPREVLVLCLHLVRGDPGHIARVLGLKQSQYRRRPGGSSFT